MYDTTTHTTMKEVLYNPNTESRHPYAIRTDAAERKCAKKAVCEVGYGRTELQIMRYLPGNKHREPKESVMLCQT